MRTVEIVHEDLKPSDIMTREAFINAIRVNSAIGGSTNAPIHLNAIARHLGVELTIEDWQTYGEEIPLLVNLQPAGEYLGEDYYHAGGVPAVVGQLIEQGLIDEDAMTVNGKTVGENCRGAIIIDETCHPPLRPAAEGARRLPGAERQPLPLRDDEDERDLAGVPRALPLQPGDPERVRGAGGGVRRAGGLPPPHRRPRPRHRRETMLFMRGAGPKGYPGAAEVVNMRAPDYLLKRGIIAALHRRRPPVGHLGLALDPQRLAGGGRGRRPRHPADRRPGALDLKGALTCWSPTRSWRSAAPSWRRRAATTTPPTRRRGRKSSAALSASSRPARCWSRR